MADEDKDIGNILLEMDKQHHGNRRRESARYEWLKKIILFLAGCLCSYMGVMAFSKINSKADAVFGVLKAAMWGAGAGVSFAHCFLDGIGHLIGNSIYAPVSYLKVPPEKLSPIKGQIIAGKIAEAIEQLRNIVERHPQTAEAVLMLAELYSDATGELEQAQAVLENYFGNAHPVETENIDMLLLYSDICRELGQNSRAVNVLEQELQYKGYSKPDRKSIRTRLKAISGD